MDKKKILIITTNISELADGSPTGVWLEEFAVPYIIFEKTGYTMTISSPLGGESPIDTESLSCSNPMEWDDAAKRLKNTQKIDEINPNEFDAVFFPGGHGPMFDIAQNEKIGEIVSKLYNDKKIVSAVCHGAAGLILATDSNGKPIVENKRLTSFTNEEERIVKKAELIPFSLEDKLKELGAEFIESKPWTEHAEVSDNLITGQNPASAIAVAEEVVKKLQ